MEIIIQITEEQSVLLVENAIRNFPDHVIKQPKEILEYIIESTTNHDRRTKVQDKFDRMTVLDLETLFRDKGKK